MGLGPAQHPGFPPGSFDYVLLDAPCTALGLRPRLEQQQVRVHSLCAWCLHRLASMRACASVGLNTGSDLMSLSPCCLQTLQALLETAVYQRQLMGAAVQLLKPGGTLVYSTCTINPGARMQPAAVTVTVSSCIDSCFAADSRRHAQGSQQP